MITNVTEHLSGTVISTFFDVKASKGNADLLLKNLGSLPVENVFFVIFRAPFQNSPPTDIELESVL